MNEFGLTGEAAELASRIRSVDRRLDALEKDRERSIAFGMAATGLASALAKRGQEAADVEQQRLVADRAALVRRLKALLGHE